jgi:hypothetical protein
MISGIMTTDGSRLLHGGSDRQNQGMADIDMGLPCLLRPAKLRNPDMGMILVTLYLLGCTVCGIMGRNTAWGFLGHFFLSIVLTPIGDLFIQLAGRPSREIREKINKLS